MTPQAVANRPPPSPHRDVLHQLRVPVHLQEACDRGQPGPLNLPGHYQEALRNSGVQGSECKKIK